MELNEWKNKNKYIRNYSHFDKRISLSAAWNYISNPDKIASHGFYPFIHYTKKFIKYNKVDGTKLKEREICYSAHIDRLIFQYYSYLLNGMYNERVIADGIDNTAIAYRNNMGKNNIHFAKSAFDYIRSSHECFIMVGDFTKFFDSLDHKYLKDRLCDLIGVKKLPPDFYAVYKNIIKYSVWDMKELLKLNNLSDDKNGINELKEKEQVLTPELFKQHKKTYIKQNKNNYGIPQGSAISAVLSNIYMLDIDKKINDFVNIKNGLYMRYSDDFIVVLPEAEKENFQIDFDYIINQISSVPNLVLQPDKTQVYRYDNGILTNRNDEYLIDVEKGKDLLNYLGFTFDGKAVTIRDKTISKYYYKMYRKLKTIVKAEGFTKNGNRISCNNLYLKYTRKGAHVGKGNFISYVQRSQKIFGNSESIDRGTSRHLQKIRQQLDKI